MNNTTPNAAATSDALRNLAAVAKTPTVSEVQAELAYTKKHVEELQLERGELMRRCDTLKAMLIAADRACTKDGHQTSAVSSRKSRLGSGTNPMSRDPYNEWYQRNWERLMREFFIERARTGSRLTFGPFCDMQFMSRRIEPLRAKDWGLLKGTHQRPEKD